MVVYVMNRGPSPKGDDEDDSNEHTALEAPEQIEEGLLTPTSSAEQATATLTTPIDSLSVRPARSLPGSFPMQEPLSFDGTGGPDRSYYGTPPQYTDSFSQSILSTPVSADIISPHDISVFDYSAPTSFASSTPDQQRPGAPSQYDTWTPPFRQNIFSPIDYSASATHALHPPPSIPYHIPMAAPAQLHDMSHHHAPALGSALPFRTGSLGHPHGMPLSHPV